MQTLLYPLERPKPGWEEWSLDSDLRGPLRHLLRYLRRGNPDLSVVWLPTILLHPLSWGAMVLQKLLRPRSPAINVAKVFSVDRCDTSGAARLAAQMPTEPAGVAPAL